MTQTCPDPLPGCGGGGGGGGDGGGGGGGGGVSVDVPSVQDFIDQFIPELVKKLVKGLKDDVFTDDVLRGPISDGIDSFITKIKEDARKGIEQLFEGLITPLVETPAPKGGTSAGPVDIAFRSATNAPWDSLIPGVYFEGIVGLALGIQFITLAAVGLRYQSMDSAVRKKVGRRIVWAFLAIFLWLPAASLATQFFDIIARQLVFAIYDPDKAIATISSVEDIAKKSLGFFLVLIAVGVYVYFKALFVAIARWMIVILLTLCMPLVAAFWPLEVWPFNRFSGIAKQVAGAYPGALAAGIPAAVLIRISLETDAWGLPDSLTIIVPIVTLYLAAKAQKEMIRRSSSVAVRVSEQTLAGAKQSVKKPAKIGGAVAAGAVTAGAGAAAGAGGARAASGGISAVSSAAKGRIGQTAFNVQRLHRGLSQAKFSRGNETSNGSSTTVDGPPTAPKTTVVDDAQSKQTRRIGNGSQSKTTVVDNTAGSRQTVPPDKAGEETVIDGTEGQPTTTYWDVVDDESQFGADTEVYRPGESPDDSAGEDETPALGSDVDIDDDDEMAAGATPTTDSGDDDDPPATGGDANVKELFANAEGPLGPDRYR